MGTPVIIKATTAQPAIRGAGTLNARTFTKPDSRLPFGFTMDVGTDPRTDVPTAKEAVGAMCVQPVDIRCILRIIICITLRCGFHRPTSQVIHR